MIHKRSYRNATMINNTTVFIRKSAAEKLRAVERVLGVTRSTLIEWLLHKQGLIDLDVTHKDSPDIDTLETAKNNPDVKTMIKNNIKKVNNE